MFVSKQKQPRSLFACCSSLFLLLVSTTILVIFVARESNSFTFLPTSTSKKHKRCDNSIGNMRSTNDKSEINAAVASRNGTESAADESSSNRSSCLVLPAFPNRIPTERLGTKHESLEAFHKTVFGTTTTASRPVKKTKEYTLIVVTETLQQQQQQPRRQRILLGLKNRGFGTGKYNSFGGKFLHDGETTITTAGAGGGGDVAVAVAKETVEACACRELEEETNLKIPLEEMKASKVGIQKFTFADNDKEMLVHLFFIDLANNNSHYRLSDPNWSYEIKECEEITPRWFEHFDDIPLDNMFADDSLWMTALLTRAAATPIVCAGPPLEINGSYYFAENCEETNTILHYHMDVKIPPAANYSKSNST
jgi:8-oxo-dGTP pyrophosphatase MutT (NUDIX family)